jgi:hypothetical protein
MWYIETTIFGWLSIDTYQNIVIARCSRYAKPVSPLAMGALEFLHELGQGLG